MAVDIVMPMFSETMEQGTVVKWLKQVGDPVTVGEDLVEVETEKANIVYASDAAGILLQIMAPEGTTLAVGTPIARIGAPGEALGAQAPTSPVERGSARANASPLVRRLAEERGLDLSLVAGTGPRGRITRSDVERALAGGAPAAQPEGTAPSASVPKVSSVVAAARGPIEVVPLSKRRQAVARRMSHAKSTVPHFYLTVEADVTDLLAARERMKAAAATPEDVPSFNDVVILAVARALREHPDVNAGYGDATIERYGRVNVGMAVASDEGLVVATIFDADRMRLAKIARAARDVVERVRSGDVTAEELGGATFTVSNLGMYGIDSFSAIINPPQAAILAVGRPLRKPVIDTDGSFVARDRVSLTLSCDHRALSGGEAARFLVTVRERLEAPLDPDA